MEVEALVRRGRNKERCEDRCLIGERVLCDIDGRGEMKPPFIVAIADGVGGNRLGDMAAGYVLQNLANADISGIKDAAALKQLIRAQNDALIALARGISGAENMATTLCGAMINQYGIFAFNAGNSRIYEARGAQLVQLTHDHTTYAYLTRAGRADEARACNRSEITCCMGNGNASQLSQLEVFPIPEFTALLFTSDGVHDALGDDQMESVLSRAGSPEEACRLLCDTAQLLGSRDDVTAAILF